LVLEELPTAVAPLHQQAPKEAQNAARSYAGAQVATMIDGFARHVRFTLRTRHRQPARHVRLVPGAAIEDDGTILYSIPTCSLPDASPKVYPG
jgi:hypothetical protein